MYEKICPNCKTSLSGYYRTGMLGCPKCYQAFSTEIEQTLIKIQKSTEHKGKRPSFGVERELLAEYNKLLSQKELAVMEGRFSDVKKISAELFELTEELKRKGLI